MKFVLIFGPPAVGKMTVGHELAKATGLKLFHNHMTIEPLYAIFGASAETWNLSTLFRNHIFAAAAKSRNLAGLIFTFVWALDLAEDWAYVDSACATFESEGWTVYLVELQADLQVRLERNRTPWRLEHKPTKRDVERSEANLRETVSKYRLNSKEGEISRPNFLKIDNSHLSAQEVAALVRRTFDL